MTMRRARVRRAMVAVLGGLLAVVPVVPADAADTDLTPGAVRHERAAAGARTDGTTAYAVPFGDAGLGRITTAPNGDMWFILRKAQWQNGQYVNLLGRIQANGAMSYFPFAADSEYETLKDVDIAADGRVWVLAGTGSWVYAFYPSNFESGTPYTISSLPRGQQLRIGPDGATPWITLGYDTHGVARVVGGSVQASNGPGCKDEIARGAQGTMWCTTDVETNVKRLAGDGSSSQAYPLPADATYPYSLAAGPQGAIWFGRDSGESMFSSAGNGSVGWFDLGSSDAHVIPVGRNVAPRSLTLGPDGNMWFASIGVAKGIGHANAAGLGAVTQVGNWQPRGLTFGPDGAIWFTDDVNNAIVRVPTSALRTTNVDIGLGSAPGRVVAFKTKKKGAKRLFVGTVSAASPTCAAGKLQVRRVKGKKSVVVAKGRAKASGRFKIAVATSKLPKGKYLVRVKGNGACPEADSPIRKVR